MTEADKITYILDVTGWSQQALADEIGVIQSTISAWKRGRTVKEDLKSVINRIYNQARRIEWERKQNSTRTKPRFEPKVLSRRGKIRIMFPYYPHQRRVTGRK